jgi:predicted negative regulator of RcsB-dependent stress response
MFGIKTIAAAAVAGALLSSVATFTLVNDHWQAKVNRQAQKAQAKYDVAVDTANKSYQDEAHKFDDLDKKHKDLEFEHSKDTTCLLSPSDADRLR